MLQIIKGIEVFQGCSLTKSGTQSINNTTFTAVTFDGEEFDPTGLHSTSSNTARITLTAGYWLAGGAIGFQGLSDRVEAITTIYKNGAILGANSRERMHVSWAVASAANMDPAFSRLVKADVDGDYIELVAYHNQGVAVNVGTNCHFWAVKVGVLP